MSKETTSFLVGAAVGLAGVLTYLAPAIAQQTPDLGAVYHRLQWHVIGPAGQRSDTPSGVPGDSKGLHRRRHVDRSLNTYRRA
jgi:hypothetical protein